MRAYEANPDFLIKECVGTYCQAYSLRVPSPLDLEYKRHTSLPKFPSD